MIPSDKNLSNKDLRGVDFSSLDLSHANFENANLAGAIFKKTSLTRAKLLGANLEGANLEQSILQGADLRKANLRGANLIEAYARWTDFRGAKLDDANFENAVLEVARFEEASLQGTRLIGISYNSSTTWPEGFKPHQYVMTMSTQDVNTVHDLLNLLGQLSASKAIDYDGSLEQYLRSLWGVINELQVELLSANLAGYIFSEAFAANPLPFDDEWLAYQSLPLAEEVPNDFSFLQATI